MTQPSVLPLGLHVIGDVEAGEDFIVLGEITGTVRIAGALVIEAGGVVRGPVDAHVVIVRGTLVGDATADEMIRVDVGATMVGDTRAPRVNVVTGAKFRGRVELVGELEPRLPRVPRRATSAGSLVSPVAKTSRTVPGSLLSPIGVAPQAAAPVKNSPAVEAIAPAPAKRKRPSPKMPAVKRSVASKRGER